MYIYSEIIIFTIKYRHRCLWFSHVKAKQCLDVYSTQFHEYVSDLPPPGRILVAIQQQLVSLFRKTPIYQRNKLEPRLACNAIFHELKFQNSAKAGEVPRKLVEFTILIGLWRRGSPTGGFVSHPYSFVSFRKVSYAYNISARNRHPHGTIHKPSLLHATFVSVWNQIATSRDS